MKNQFRIKDPSGRTENKRYNTLEEVVKDLKSGKRDIDIQEYYIEDLVDDIVIPANELLHAYDNGERPKDLQFF